MDANYLTDPLIFIIDTLFSLYILAILLRFLLQWCGANFYNPLSQFLVRITHPPIKILRRYIPAFGKIDTSSLVLALSLQMSSDFAIYLLKGVTINIGALAVLAFTQLISLILNIFVFAVFARALLSWFNPGAFNEIADVLTSLTEPLLNLCRKFIPYLGGVDLSPLAALLILQLAKMVVLPPMYELVNYLTLM
jgi:YggT family protein